MSLVSKLDYHQKRIYLNYLKTKKKFSTLPFGLKTKFSLLLFTLLLYPGQNYFQTLNFHPQEPKVKASTITVESYPIPINDGTQAPSLTAQSIMVFDPLSGTIIFQKNSHLHLHPASTTKIMTALVALDVYDLDEVLTVKHGPEAIGHSVELEANQQFTVKDILYALLVSSGNDAALTLAENYEGDYLAYVDLMNQKAIDLNLVDTHFSNVSGIESYNHKTSVHDLTILAKEALKSPLFKEIVATSKYSFTDITGATSYELTTTNELLGKVIGLSGIKTGWTENAGECLVAYTERDSHPIITVVLNSANRFGETESLINWVFSHHTWQNLL